MIQVQGFMPDVDPTTPGALIDVTNVIPTNTGMVGAPQAVAATNVPALAAACRNAAVAYKLDGSRRIFAGTSTKLYELSSGSWTDQSRVGNYTLGTDDRWDFAQFGDATLAATLTAKIQRSPGAGAFADIATAPQAAVLEVVSGFAIAFNTIDGTYGTSPDRWWCSAAFDETTWTPSVTTQATTGRLVSSPGPITAAKAFGDQVVAYKERAVFLGSYVGAPVVWQWNQIPGEVGCVGPDAVADIGPAHIFVGRGDIYVFDGTRPYSIAEGQVRQWFFNNCSPTYIYRTQVVYDRQMNRVWVFFPSNNGGGVVDSAMVYHLGTKQWGLATVSVEASMTYIAPGVTFDTWGTTFDSLPNVGFDSAYWTSGSRQLAVFNASHQLCTMQGIAGNGSFTLNYMGDDDQVSRLKRIRVGWQTQPTTASLAGSTAMVRGGSYTGSNAGSYSDGKFDLRQTGRWHKAVISTTGDMAFNSFTPEFDQAGKR